MAGSRHRLGPAGIVAGGAENGLAAWIGVRIGDPKPSAGQGMALSHAPGVPVLVSVSSG
jgi:hypothetical protein